MDNIDTILSGGQKPGDATQETLWNAFKDIALFTALKCVFNLPGVDKESIKAEIIDKWEEQQRLDFSRSLDEHRHILSDDAVLAEMASKGLECPNLGQVEAEFDIHLAKVKGMVMRVVDRL